MSHRFDPTVLREYDIRGVIDETLGAEDARAIGRGFATLLRQAGESWSQWVMTGGSARRCSKPR